MNREALEALLAEYRDAVLFTERESQWGPVVWETQNEEEVRKEILDAFTPQA